MTDSTTTAMATVTPDSIPTEPSKLLAQLDPQLVEQARQMATSLKEDESQILGLGASDQRQLAQLSSRFMDEMKVKDTSVVGDALNDLLDQINAINPNSLTSYVQGPLTHIWVIGGIASWFDGVVRFKRKFDTINTRVGQLAEGLRRGSNTMQEGMDNMKDQAEKCRVFRMGLLRAIAASYFKKQELEQERDRVQGLEQTEETREKLRRLNMFIRAFDRKIEDLMGHQLAALQVAYMMDNIAEDDFGLLSALTTATQTTIPQWRFRAAAALGIVQQRQARQLIDAVRETNTRVITGTTDLYHTEAIETAHSLEKGSIDPNALKTANDTMIATATEIQRIRSDAETKRRQSIPNVIQWTQTLQVTMSSFD